MKIHGFLLKSVFLLLPLFSLAPQPSKIDVDKLNDYSILGFDNYNEYVELNNIEKKDVYIAVLDSGIDTDNKYLEDRVSLIYGKGFLYSKEYTNGNSKYLFEDDNGRGTMISGIIKDSTDSNVKIIPIKISNDHNETSSYYLTDALNYISSVKTDYHINVASVIMPYVSDDISDAVLKLCNNDILPIMYTTDKSDNIAYDGNALLINSITENSMYDNYHYLSSYSDYGSGISYSLIGDNLLTTVPDFYKSEDILEVGNAKFTHISGSFLSAALMASITSRYNVIGIDNVGALKEALMNNSYDLGDKGKDSLYGYGMPSLNLGINNITISEPTLSFGNLDTDNDFSDSFDLEIDIPNQRSGYDYKIYYSTDGSYPYYGVSSLYENNISITNSTLLKFIIYAIDGNDIIASHSKMYETAYFLNGEHVNKDGNGLILDSSSYITKYVGGIKDIEIPSTINGRAVRGIAADAFMGLNLNSVKATFNIALGKYPFNSTNIKKIELENVNYNEVVKDSKALEELSLSKLRTILPGDDGPSLTFANTPELKKLNLSSITQVPNYAFKNLTNLDTLVITNVSQIGDEAFYNTTSLHQTLDLYNVTRVGSNAFDGCGYTKIKTTSTTLYKDYENVMVLSPTILKENNKYYITGYDLTLMIYMSDDDKFDASDKLIYQNRYSGLNDNKLLDYDRFSTGNKYYFFRLLDKSYNTIIESFVDSSTNELLFITASSTSSGTYNLNKNSYYSGEEVSIDIYNKTGSRIKKVMLGDVDITSLITNNNYKFNIDKSYVLDIEYERILYNITLNIEGHGDIKIKYNNEEITSSYYSNYITILPTPDSGYILTELTYGNSSFKNSILSSSSIGFYMPAYDIEIKAVFALKSEVISDYQITYQDDLTYIMYGYDGNDKYLSVPLYIYKDDKTYRLCKINNSCFYNKQDIVKIELDNKSFDIEIGDSAFQNCSSLMEVDISISYIGDYAFYGCMMLNKITLSDNLRYIGKDAFINCIKLQNVYYDSNINNWLNIQFVNEYSNPMSMAQSIYAKNDNNIYYEVTSLEILEANKIGDYQFYGFKALNSITFTSNLLSIGEKAFFNCNHVRNLVLPGNVTTIKKYAFANMTYLKSIKINDAALIEEGILVGAVSLEELELPFVGRMLPTGDSIRYPIGYLFGTNSYSSSIQTKQIIYDPAINKEEYKSYYIPRSLKKISITKTDIIGYAALYNINVETIILPDNLKEIEAYAFYKNEKLEEINIGGSEIIGDYAFYNNINLTGVSGDDIKSVGYHSFDGDVKLDNINLANTTTISDYAFYNNVKLARVYLDNLVYVFSYAFYNCGINVLNLKKIKYIGLKAFESNKALEDIYLSNTLERIDADAFYLSNSIKNIYYNSDTLDWCNITFQNEYANPMFYADEFYVLNNNSYEKLNTIRIPNNFKLKAYIFVNFDLIENIFIPKGLKEIEAGAFYSLSGIKNVFYEGTIEDWANIKFNNRYSNPMCYATNLYFESSKEVTELTLSNLITKIGAYQFMNIKSLKKINISKDIKSVGDYAFYGCDNIESIIYAGNKDEWNLIEFGEFKANPLNITTNITYNEVTPKEEKKEEEKKQEEQKQEKIEKNNNEIILFVAIGITVLGILVILIVISIYLKRRD